MARSASPLHHVFLSSERISHGVSLRSLPSSLIADATWSRNSLGFPDSSLSTASATASRLASRDCNRSISARSCSISLAASSPTERSACSYRDSERKFSTISAICLLPVERRQRFQQSLHAAIFLKEMCLAVSVMVETAGVAFKRLRQIARSLHNRFELGETLRYVWMSEGVDTLMCTSAPF